MATGVWASLWRHGAEEDKVITLRLMNLWTNGTWPWHMLSLLPHHYCLQAASTSHVWSSCLPSSTWLTPRPGTVSQLPPSTHLPSGHPTVAQEKITKDLELWGVGLDLGATLTGTTWGLLPKMLWGTTQCQRWNQGLLHLKPVPQPLVRLSLWFKAPKTDFLSLCL